MDLNNIISDLKDDLNREYDHLHYYLAAAGNLKGCHRITYASFFREAAASELKHVLSFLDLIRQLDVLPPILGYEPTPVPAAGTLLTNAIKLEQEVAEHYCKRISDCEEVEKAGGSDAITAKYIRLFIEAQLQDSMGDLLKMKDFVD